MTLGMGTFGGSAQLIRQEWISALCGNNITDTDGRSDRESAHFKSHSCESIQHSQLHRWIHSDATAEEHKSCG